MATTVSQEELMRGAQAIQASGSRDHFVDFILSGQPEPPPYFARMKRANREGPALLNHLPEPPEVNAAEIESLVSAADAALIDTRTLEEYLEGHLKGALSISLDKAFPTTAGSYIGPEQPIYLILDRSRLREAILDLTRIGLDRIAGFITTETLRRYREDGGSLRTTEQIDISEMKRRLGSGSGGAFLLDVRGGAEFVAGHVRAARNIAHTRLALRVGELPPDAQILVICQVGERSGYAASYLETLGYDAVHIRGGFSAWTDAHEAVCSMPACQC